jgi:hypothetical protein
MHAPVRCPLKLVHVLRRKTHPPESQGIWPFCRAVRPPRSTVDPWAKDGCHWQARSGRGTRQQQPDRLARTRPAGSRGTAATSTYCWAPLTSPAAKIRRLAARLRDLRLRVGSEAADQGHTDAEVRPQLRLLEPDLAATDDDQGTRQVLLAPSRWCSSGGRWSTVSSPGRSGVPGVMPVAATYSGAWRGWPSTSGSARRRSGRVRAGSGSRARPRRPRTWWRPGRR